LFGDVVYVKINYGMSNTKLAESKIRILIVEDEPMLLEMYGIAFRNSSFEILTAVNGHEGWQKIQTAPNMVLLDIKMDDMSGIEILKRIQNDSNLKLKIIVWVLSNVGEETVSQEAIKLGAEEYIMKTKITPSELVAKVKERLKN